MKRVRNVRRSKERVRNYLERLKPVELREWLDDRRFICSMRDGGTNLTLVYAKVLIQKTERTKI